MTRRHEQPDRVRLAPADWGGLCMLALTLLTLAGATLYEVHQTAQTNRERLAAVDAELSALKRSVELLQTDVRALARRNEP